MQSQLIDSHHIDTNHATTTRSDTTTRGTTTSDTRPAIPVGVRVELRSRFDDRWTHGFAIAVCGHEEYQVRRLSDGHVLPAWFPAAMLRPILDD
jgi:hypothetical protein